MALLLTLAGSAGCHRTRTSCSAVASVGALVEGAVLLRLDVYDDAAYCVDGILAGDPSAPMRTQTFARGQPITLSLVPGRHTLVLTTYSDAIGRERLGQACAETLVAAGSDLCLDLTVLPLGDAALATDAMVSDALVASDALLLGDAAVAGDAATVNDAAIMSCAKDSDCGASGLVCCGSQCVSTMSDAKNCGGCGNVCDTTTSSARSCAAGKCSYTCNAGLVTCNGGTGPDLDGCECAGTACCGASCPYKHHTKVGQETNPLWPLFYDCTTSQAAISMGIEAQAACNQYALANGKPMCQAHFDNCTNQPMYCYDPSNSFCWVYGKDSHGVDYSGVIIDYSTGCGGPGTWD